MLATVDSATLLGVDGQPSPSRCTSRAACPATPSSGCPTPPGRESRERVRAALLSSATRVARSSGSRSTSRPPRYARPAPASSSRSRSRCSARGRPRRPDALDGVGVLGELGLDGSRPRRCRARSCSPTRSRTTGVEHGDRARPRTRTEAALVPGLARPQRPHPRRAARRASRARRRGPIPIRRPPEPTDPADAEPVDLAEVRGLATAPRSRSRSPPPAATICCSPGRPGCGKTMLARRLPTILPPLDADEALEVTRIGSVAGGRPPESPRPPPAVPGPAPHRHAPRRSSVAAPAVPAPARSPSPTGVCCSSTSSASSRRCARRPAPTARRGRRADRPAGREP